MTSINFPNTPSQGDTHEHLGITWICTHIAPVPRWAKTGDQAFNNIHLGAFAAAPIVDNNGAPLIAGQTYWDTVLDSYFVYSGLSWTIPAVVYTGDGLLPLNNLSDVASASGSLANLGGAPLASPALTGTPTAPTASPKTNSTQVATTEYVDSKSTILTQAQIMAYI